MPLPGSVTMVVVTEDYRRADGSTPSGSVTFTPSVRSTVAGTSIVVEPVTAVLASGQLSVSLAWQDDTDLSPNGWTYTVVENIAGEIGPRTRSIVLPQTGPVALHTLAPTDPVSPTEVRVRTVEGIEPDSSGNIDLPPAAGSAPNTRLINTTNGLQGGGDLTADRTLSPVYGSTAGTVCQGNDSRLSDSRTPLAHTHPVSDVTGLQTALDAKATKVVVRQAYVMSGNIQLNTGTNTWGPLTGSPTLVIPAAVGDYVELDASVLRQANSNIFLDIGVLVSSSIVRYLATGTATPAGEGDPGLYITALPARSGSRGFTVASGDLSGGNVTFTFAIRNISGASALLLASTDNPLYWRAMNLGAVS